MAAWLNWLAMFCLFTENLQWTYSKSQKYKRLFHYDVRQMMSNEITLFFDDNSFKEVTCNADNDGFASPEDARKSTACKPRSVVVPLVSPVKMHKLLHFYPSHMELNRCSGSCNLNHRALTTCTPTKVQTIEIPVTAILLKPPTDTEAKCFMVKVQEHSACTCNCTVQERHCIPNKQKYDRSRCRCECTDSKQQASCDKQGKIWDPVNCSCHCHEVSPCSTGSLFDPDKCLCVKVLKIGKKQLQRLNKLKSLKKPKHN